MRRHDKLLIARSILHDLGIAFLGVLLGMLLASCSYLGRNGASLYCTDAQKKAIRCPPLPKDSTKADTVRR